MNLADLASNNKPPKPSEGKKFEAKMKVKTWPALHMLSVDFPKPFVDELNTFIDDVVIPDDKDYGHSLVGQIRQDEKSKQLTFPLEGHEFAVEFKKILDSCATNYIQQAYKKQSHAETYDAWTVHSYAGDYNPLHDHGTRSFMGLSCILFLKVPPQIEAIGLPSEEMIAAGVTPGFQGLNGASGAVDGFTYLCWGVNGMRDVNMLRPIQEEYVKPEVGTMIIFPAWLRHAVMPFSGEGERRTFSANINVHL